MTAKARVQSAPRKQRPKPQAGIEHAGERVQNLRERVLFPREGAGTADFDYRVPTPSEFQSFGRSTQDCGGGRHARLHDAQVANDESRVRVTIDQRGARLQVALVTRGHRPGRSVHGGVLQGGANRCWQCCQIVFGDGALCDRGCECDASFLS
jgi:hypothetical protein